MKIIARWFLLAFIILVTAYYVPGIKVNGLWPALVLILILGLVNVTLKPLFILITLPINILTLGLFTFVINAFLVWFTSTIVKGFYLDGFLSALLFAVVLSTFNFFINKAFN